jgi:hypothetical protein
MNTLSVLLRESEAKILLEALTDREQELLGICESSDDQDVVADTGNDLIELRLLLNSLREQAVKTFGSGVLNFSREPL